MIIDLTELKKLTFYKEIKCFIKTKEEQIDILSLIEYIESKCSHRFSNGGDYSEKLYRAFELTGISHNCYYEYNSRKIVNYTCAFKDGKLDGSYNKFYSDRTDWIKCNYKDDKLDGEYVEYYKYIEKSNPNCLSATPYQKNRAIKKKAYYKDGKLDGVYQEFSRSGTLLKNETYENGILINL